jgi:putative ABC transport system permease protein
MKTPLRKPFRDLRRIKVRALSIVLMVAVGLGAGAGIFLSRESVSHTRDTLYEALRLGDLRVVTSPSDPSELPSLEGIPGVTGLQKRLLSPGAIERRDGRLLNSLIVYLDPGTRPAVNDLKILAGTFLDPEQPDGVVIERSLAEIHGYGIGDRLTLNPYTAPVDVRVIGIAISPECLIATVDSTVFFPMKGSLGVVFAPMSLVEKVFGTPLYNEFSFRFELGNGATGREERILELLAPLGIESVTRREEEFAYRFLQESLKGFSAFIPSLAGVFTIVIFLVTSITAQRLVATQRMEIGVLRALGYRRREILVSYLILALCLSTLGSLIGAGVSVLINRLFASQYASALGLPGVIPVMDPCPLLLGWILASAVVALAFFLPLRSLLRLPPQAILRPERKKAFQGIPSGLARAGRRLAWLIRPRLSFRFGFRNLFRRFGLTLATVLCVALPIALGSAFLVVLHSVNAYKDELFQREKWDIMVNFRYPLSPDRAADILRSAGADPGALGVSGFGQVRAGTLTMNDQLLAFPVDRNPRELNLVSGRMFRDDQEKGIILNRNWLGEDRDKLHVGDRASVQAGSRKEELEIVGLMSDMTVGQAYLPLGTAQVLLGMEGTVNGAMTSASVPVDRAKEALFRHEEVGEVFTLPEIRTGMQEYMDQMQGVFHASVAVSLVIATLFLLGSVLLNILEREMEFATLRAIGYNRRLITKVVLTELLLETAFAVLISLPLSVALAFLINYQQGKIYFHIPTSVRAVDLLMVSVGSFLFIPLASLPALRHLFRMNIGDVVRRKVMG